MNMVERVARAIYEKRNGAGCNPWSLRTKAHKAPYLDDARAAIEALREPTEDMMKEAWRSQFKFVGASDDEANTLVQMRSEKDLHFDLGRLGWLPPLTPPSMRKRKRRDGQKGK